MRSAKKIIISLLGFMVLTAGIIAGTYLVQKNQDIREKAAPATSLSFSPSSINKNPGQTFNITINADTGENKMTGVDIEVSYDPSIIQLTDMSPTTSLSKLVTILKDGEINNTIGKARFSAFTVVKADGISGALDIITLTGSILGSSPSGQYPISFTTSTTITAANEDLNVVINSQNATVIVASGGSATGLPTSTTTASPSPSPTSAGGIGGSQITLPTANPTATATTKATVKPTATSTTSGSVQATLPPDVPVTGISLPFVGGISLGAVALLFSLFLAF